LDGVEKVRPGQICHLSKDPSRTDFDDLVWLCLEHHDRFDSRTSQSKGFTSDEVRTYRNKLYKKNPDFSEITKQAEHTTSLEPLEDENVYEKLKRRFSKQTAFLSRSWRFALWQSANEPDLFAYKAPASDGVCLIERIDIPDGRIVIVCIQPLGNPGSSITNSVEHICFQVCERFGIPSERLVWLEHYDDDRDGEWRMVKFKLSPPGHLFGEPEWEVMTSKMWKDLRLKPKKKMPRRYGLLGSKIRKLFPWPNEALF
jgi:hypothetical protein